MIACRILDSRYALKQGKVDIKNSTSKFNSYNNHHAEGHGFESRTHCKNDDRGEIHKRRLNRLRPIKKLTPGRIDVRLLMNLEIVGIIHKPQLMRLANRWVKLCKGSNSQ